MTTRKKSTPKKKAPIEKSIKAKNKKTSSANTRDKQQSNKSVMAKKPSPHTLTLNPVLVIDNAKSLMLDFSQIIKNNNDIGIDASSVEMIDTAILQLLLAFTIKIKASGNNVHWINPSDKFITNASLLGLSKQLNIS